ncbi:MAG: sigma-70 family RNA polymerase sigma factor [Phycisphaeraceae bacterium]|nr:MAG: sigma-70 family RNA polymerase sigma factor [Phycisphaeraceae bacterium]
MPDRTPDQIYDEWLVIRSQDGEVAALTELVSRWNGRLIGFAMGLTGEEAAALDAVQGAWLVAARDIGKLRDPARFASWMLRVVGNRCADLARRESRRRRTERARAFESDRRITNPEEVAGDSDESERVRRAIRTLGNAQREILGLHHGAGISVSAIASMLGVPEGTVKSRLHAARSELRTILERRTT